MKLIIDTDRATLTREDLSGQTVLDLYGSESYALIANQYIRVGWNQKHDYRFTWFGRPIIQLPSDMVRMQEVIYSVKPDVIVETGVAHGGSLIYYASLCKAMGRGRVIGIDVEIRLHNRMAIESHELFPHMTLVQGNSTDMAVIERVRSLISPEERVLVILDSCHSKNHVLQELRSYASLVTPGSYLVATDGVMRDLYDVPRGKSEWKWDNPSSAALQFAAETNEFDIVSPDRPFDESMTLFDVTHWPDAWLLRRG